MGQHRDVTGQNMHVAHRWVVADAAARLALSVGPEDVGKVAKQETPLSFWILTDDDPLTWQDITAGGGAISHDSLTGVTADQHHNQQHAIDGADHTGSLAHSALTGVGTDDHHARDHAASHGPAQPDALKLDDLAAPDDNTDLNTSTSAHGLAPKLDNDGNHYLDGQGNWTTPAGSGGTFGADYQSEESLGESSTSSTEWQTKVTLTTPALTGTYRVGASMRTWHSNTLDSAVSRLYNVTDDVELLGPYDEEAENSTNRRPNGGFANVVFTGAVKTFRIEFKQDRGGTAYINQARLELWRVA